MLLMEKPTVTEIVLVNDECDVLFSLKIVVCLQPPDIFG